MAKYLCPTCGAVHKEYVPQCRLCGQSLSPDLAPVSVPQSATIRTTKGSNKGIVLLGIGFVVAVIAVALFFGLVSGNKQIDFAKDKVIPGSVTDGWSSLSDADGPITVLLPGDRTRSSSAFPGTTDGKITVWTTKISTDTIITVGYGTVAPLPVDATTGSAPPAAAVQNYLKELSGKWVQSQGSDPLIGGQATYVSGFPAYVVKGQTRSIQVNGKPGYAQQALVLNGTKFYAVTVLSVYKEGAQFDRVVESLSIG